MMLIVRSWLLFFVLLFTTCCWGESERLLIITIPKSGTHLLVKYFRSLLLRGILKEKIWHTTHLFIDDFFSLYQQYTADKTRRAICLIRDPRDIICSLVDWLEKVHNYANIGIQFRPAWYELPRAEKIAVLLDSSRSKIELRSFFLYECRGMTLPQTIKSTIERSLLFGILNRNVLTVRFEDIVGERGRGSAVQQALSFRKINQHCLLDVPGDVFEEVVTNLWGGAITDPIPQPTFFKGYIGRWKEEFSAKAVELTKIQYGNLLVGLGYESDLGWGN